MLLYTCIHGGNDKLGSVFGLVCVLHVEFCCSHGNSVAVYRTQCVCVHMCRVVIGNH